jgi:hypothetical protein
VTQSLEVPLRTARKREFDRQWAFTTNIRSG